MSRLSETRHAIDALGPLDAHAMSQARRRLDSLTKPRRSLGRLERIAMHVAGITGDPAPGVRPRTVIVAAADHGVAIRGVSAYPQSVTAAMVRNFIAGGAAINVLANLHGVDIVVVDAGLASHADAYARPSARLVKAPFCGPTADIAAGPAMARDEAVAAVECGILIASDVVASGARLVAVGEMGIGNTTPASALVATLLRRDATQVTGRGTGLDDAQLERKVQVVRDVLVVNAAHLAGGDPIAVLAAVGGRDIAVVVGVILGATAARVPLVLDGFITGAAALIAAAICPSVPQRLVASHRSAEPGHRLVLEALALEPLLDLELRLGEGSGALLALPLVDAACALRDGMATFESAGVADPARAAVAK